MRKRPAAHSWGWQRMHLYGRPSRGEHRAISTRHGGEQPEYTRKLRNMVNRLFR